MFISPALILHMHAIFCYTSMPLIDSKPVTLNLVSQVTCYDIFHLEHWKSGVFRWLQLSEIPNPPDLQKQLPHTQACFYLLLWNSFFAMGAYIHTCALFLIWFLLSYLQIDPSTHTATEQTLHVDDVQVTILYSFHFNLDMYFINSLHASYNSFHFFLKEIERPKTPVPLEQTCVDDFHTPDKVCTLPQYISNWNLFFVTLPHVYQTLI